MSEEAKNETKLEEPSSISEAEAAAAKAKAEAKSKKASPEQIAKAEAAFEKAQAKVKQMRIASEAAWKAEYETAKARAEKIAAEGGDPGQAFTNKRKRERVFRREMGEPEFWQTKEDKAPARPARTQDEEREILSLIHI